jgi:hypothetical protein
MGLKIIILSIITGKCRAGFEESYECKIANRKTGASKGDGGKQSAKLL